MRLPAVPEPRRRAVRALAREPLGMARLDRLPGHGRLTAESLADLVRYNFARYRIEPGPAKRRVELTDFGAEVAGVVLDGSGCRWVRASQAWG